MNRYTADTHMNLIGPIHAAARYVTPANFTETQKHRTHPASKSSNHPTA